MNTKGAKSAKGWWAVNEHGMRQFVAVEDAGDGSGEDREGLRWCVYAKVDCTITGMRHQKLIGRCSTEDGANALADWCKRRWKEVGG